MSPRKFRQTETFAERFRRIRAEDGEVFDETISYAEADAEATQRIYERTQDDARGTDES